MATQPKLMVTVELGTADKKQRKTVTFDPDIKISEATQILLQKFGKASDKDASLYAISLPKEKGVPNSLSLIQHELSHHA